MHLRTLLVATLFAAACTDEAEQRIAISTTFDQDGVAVFSWEGGAISEFFVAENPGETADHTCRGAVVWNIECVTFDGFGTGENDNNCLESPLRYGEAPSGLITTSEAWVLESDQAYFANGVGFERGEEPIYHVAFGAFEGE